MTEPRRASEAVDFPYTSPRVCFIELSTDGQVRFATGKIDKRAAIERARGRREPCLFAVWPGQYRSDMFMIDDLNRAAEAVG